MAADFDFYMRLGFYVAMVLVAATCGGTFLLGYLIANIM